MLFRAVPVSPADFLVDSAALAVLINVPLAGTVAAVVVLAAPPVRWAGVAASLLLLGTLFDAPFHMRLGRLSFWALICLCFGAVLASGQAFLPLFAVFLAALTAFTDFPDVAANVIWDGDCGFCSRARYWVCLFDVDTRLDWRTFRSGAGASFGISDADARQRIYLIQDGECLSGFAAFKRILLLSPVWYLAGASILGAGFLGWFRVLPPAVLLVLFSPPIAPLGEALYALVSRNRHRLAAGSTCGLDPPDAPVVR